ncbi:MAG: hypothetical protein V3T49_08600, partial [Dehalococcoidia bacterium]
MASVEIIGRLAFFGLEPVLQLVAVALTVQLYLRPRVKTVRCFWRESVPVVVRREGRVCALGGFVMKSDCPQLLLGQECPAAAAGDWAIGITESGEFADRQSHSATLAHATVDSDDGNSTIRSEKSRVSGKILFGDQLSFGVADFKHLVELCANLRFCLTKLDSASFPHLFLLGQLGGQICKLLSCMLGSNLGRGDRFFYLGKIPAGCGV